MFPKSINTFLVYNVFHIIQNRGKNFRDRREFEKKKIPMKIILYFVFSYLCLMITSLNYFYLFTDNKLLLIYI